MDLNVAFVCSLPPTVLRFANINPTGVSEVCRSSSDFAVLLLELLCDQLRRFKVQQEGIFSILEL